MAGRLVTGVAGYINSFELRVPRHSFYVHFGRSFVSFVTVFVLVSSSCRVRPGFVHKRIRIFVFFLVFSFSSSEIVTAVTVRSQRNGRLYFRVS